MKSLLQTKQWAELKAEQGWQVHEVEDIFVLEKKLPMGKNFLYVPEVTWTDIDTKLQNIYKNTKNTQTIFIRVEVLDKNDVNIIKKLKENGFVKAFEEVQPQWRQIINIEKTEEEILAQMKEKGRYNIRVAQKHNIKVEKTNNIDEFYKLFTETAKRDGFEIRPKQYFEKLMQKLEKDGLAEILIARYNDIPVAAEIVTYYDDVASYLYGASSSENRNTMAPYLLHFEAMKKAKEKGCKVYDLLAVDPAYSMSHIAYGDSENQTETAISDQRLALGRGKRLAISKPGHKYAGIGRFKRQFGGKTVNVVGSWDYIYKPTWYKIFKIAEKFRRK